MLLTKVQISEQMCKHAQQKNGLHDLMEIQSMIYTTNWIERLNRDFRRVMRMRTAMPNDESILTLMGSVAMDHKSYDRILPRITCDKNCFLISKWKNMKTMTFTITNKLTNFAALKDYKLGVTRYRHTKGNTTIVLLAVLGGALYYFGKKKQIKYEKR